MKLFTDTESVRRAEASQEALNRIFADAAKGNRKLLSHGGSGDTTVIMHDGELMSLKNSAEKSLAADILKSVEKSSGKKSYEVSLAIFLQEADTRCKGRVAAADAVLREISIMRNARMRKESA